MKLAPMFTYVETYKDKVIAEDDGYFHVMRKDGTSTGAACDSLDKIKAVVDQSWAK